MRRTRPQCSGDRRSRKAPAVRASACRLAPMPAWRSCSAASRLRSNSGGARSAPGVPARHQPLRLGQPGQRAEQRRGRLVVAVGQVERGARQAHRLLGALGVAAEPEQVFRRAAGHRRAPRGQLERRQARRQASRGRPAGRRSGPRCPGWCRPAASTPTAARAWPPASGRRAAHASAAAASAIAYTRSSAGRVDRVPVGVASAARDGGRWPCTVQASGSASMCCCTAATSPGSMRRAPSLPPGNAGRSTWPASSSRTAAQDAASPHHQVGSDGRPSSSPSSVCAMAGRKPCTALDSRKPLPSALASTRLPRAQHLHQARHAERRIGAQFERIAVVVVQASQQRVHRLQALDGLQEQPLAAHREVAAFDQRQAEVARQVGMLEVGLAVRPRRQQRDARRGTVAQARRDLAGLLLHGIEQAPVARRDVLHARARERLGKQARDDQPVVQHIAQPRRRLRALRNHPPAALGPTRQVEGDDVQVHAADRRHAVQRRAGSRCAERPAPAAARPRAAGAAGRRHRPACGRAGARAGSRRARSAAQSCAVDDQRQRFERPGPRRGRRRAVARFARPHQVVRDAVGADLLRDRCAPVVRTPAAASPCSGGRGVEEALPHRPQAAVVAAQLVPAAGAPAASSASNAGGAVGCETGRLDKAAFNGVAMGSR